MKHRLIALLILLAAGAVGFFVWKTEAPASRFPFKLGLDLAGGSHLVYRADTATVTGADVKSSMDALRDVIERRVNLFGVAEPIVQVEEGGVIGTAKEQRLIVELPGVSDIAKAIELIGKTPLLEFRLVKTSVINLSEEELAKKTVDEVFEPPELTGRFLKRADLTFSQQGLGEPEVSIEFNSEGSALFEKITSQNIGRPLAIFLDGVPISTPVIREAISGGRAQISGNFTPKEAKLLVRDLNYGSLPVPIELVSTQTIGPSLGEAAVDASVKSGIIAFIVIAIFLLFWYRLPGMVAVLALAVYVVLNLVLFKLIPVTLTAAGIAGFILSIGMAVDANILIFERMKEELRRGKILSDAMKDGFARAWLSIRHSNISSIITATILFYFAATSVVKGFALVFGIGVITSMFTAITASRIFLYALKLRDSKAVRFLFSSGLPRHQSTNAANTANS